MKKQKYTTKLLAILILISSMSGVVAQANPTYSEAVEARIKAVENSLRDKPLDSNSTALNLLERMKVHKTPAVSIAVIKNYELDWAKAYGFADKETQIPATTETLFQAASISKSLNAVGVLRWAETNTIDLNADINTYLKNWTFENRKKANGKTISIANLLSHTAGLSVHGFGGYEVGDALPTTIQILDGKKPTNTKKIKSLFEPNTKFKYSGGGTTITQLILEDNTGLNYGIYMKEQILNPIGMTDSFFTQPPPKDEPLATGHWSKGEPLKTKYHVYPEMAAAGLWTTPTDLSKYIIEMQKSLKGESNKLLSKDMTEKMMTPFLEGEATGFGVFISEILGEKYFQHGGSNEGFKCHYYASLEDGNGVVVMVNSENYDIITEIFRSVVKVYEW
ncbi:serine hydrolase domain-containing protein [Winogradskyella maritima]|uniref:Serine hydrolase domain-containing protein n=1 Tax=Winogradskyella maritima TaxID=1517766 RepID=A0ABV8AI28_9FLAO|nr:serine hydrolase domain-containing protein [Winogradskyella maritima]